NSSMAEVVKLHVYLARADAMADVQEKLARQFAGANKPAVSFVVGNLPHADVLVAMDAVALAIEKPSIRQVKQFGVSKIYPQNGVRHAAILPAGPKIYVSGMADTNSLPEATGKTLEKLVG